MTTPPPVPLYAKLIVAFSSLVLAHACYSAHEHSSIQSRILPTSSTLTTTQAHQSIPLDITLETIVAVSLLCVGIVLSGWELKPISWRVWAGQMEREKGQGPYDFLENRLGFLDIRGKRDEFRKWVKEHEATKP